MQTSILLKAIFLLLLIQTTALLCNAQLVPGNNAYAEEPKKILLSANQSIKNLKNVSYDAEFEGTGAGAAVFQSIAGKVSLANLEADDNLSVKIAISGKRFSSKTGAAEPFGVSFADKTILRLRPSEKVLIRKVISDTVPEEREFGFVTGIFGAAPYYLMTLEFFSKNPFEELLKSEILEYEGLTTINGTLCHVIYAELTKEAGKSSRKQRWYIGVKDFLPHKIEELFQNDKGRDGASTLTLSNLRVNFPPDRQPFAVQLPKGYAVQEYESPIKPLPLLALGTVAPGWNLKDETGKNHSLADYRGKVVVMDFWATYCGPCVKTMPEIEKLSKKYEKRGVKVFGVNSWEDGNATAYFKDKNYSYNLLLNGETIAKDYAVSAMPTVYVIGINGEIIYHANSPDGNLEKSIEEYLQKQKM